MKSVFILPVCMLAFAAPLMPAADRTPDPSVDATAQRIKLASQDTDDRGLDKYIGASVTGAKGEVLGEIRDFLADDRTSWLGFAVVASGGLLGFGETLRLLPTGALEWSKEDARFSVSLSGEQWRELLTISERDFEAHRIAITGKDPRRREPADSATTAGSRKLGEQLMRISTLPGTGVHVLGRDVGEIEDMILDFGAGTVRALLDPDREFAGSGDKVLVPLGRFVFAERGERLVSTTLTRADFNDLQPSWNQTTGPREPGWVADRHREQRGLPPLSDQNPVDPEVLLPTGRDTSSDSDAVSRIREALRLDARFAHAGLEVRQENGVVIVDGVATDAATRREIERIAKTAVVEAQIENRVKIRE